MKSILMNPEREEEVIQLEWDGIVQGGIVRGGIVKKRKEVNRKGRFRDNKAAWNKFLEETRI